jgi:hypothetical protein
VICVDCGAVPIRDRVTEGHNRTGVRRRVDEDSTQEQPRFEFGIRLDVGIADLVPRRSRDESTQNRANLSLPFALMRAKIRRVGTENRLGFYV